MYTGIIEAVGRVAAVKAAGQSAALTIGAGGMDLSDVSVGDSIACNGVCLTVTALVPQGFTVDVSQETLRVTSGFGLVPRSIWRSRCAFQIASADTW